jgi:hypothetical protein
VRGFEETLIYKNHTDTNLHKKIIENAHYEIIAASFLHIFHQSHPSVLTGKIKQNDIHSSVYEFGHTTNPETWGFSNETFEEIIL